MTQEIKEYTPWEEMVEGWYRNAEKRRERYGVTAEESIIKLEEAENKLRAAWNTSHAGFKLIGFKLEVAQTATIYPVKAELLFTPENGEEASLELSTRFAGVFDLLMTWIHEEVGVDSGIQLDMNLPMFHGM